MMAPLDCIAVGAHPDDVEIGCGGTVAKLAAQGYRVGIVDLTDGEPTPNSPGPEVRLAEAQEAARVLGAEMRLTLDLPNRRLFDCFEARVALAKVFRQFQPRLVLGLGGRTPMASPDHYQASLIIDAAVFYSRLTKWDEQFDHLPVHTIQRHLEYFLAFRSLTPPAEHPLIVDIADSLDAKLAAIACYRSQFPTPQAVLDRFRVFAQQQGMAAGFQAGEVLSSPSPWGARDLMGLLFNG
ncbi:MAG: PIG-L family deacetylase [Patescibacteria group bacterium]|nr:PIG-L family deacetylase [Patescibacteria group bacterium]